MARKLDRVPGGGPANDAADDRVARLLDAAIRQLPAGVTLVEAPSGRPLLRNDAASHIFGMTPETAPAPSSVADYGRYRGYHLDGREYQPQEWPVARSIATGEVVSAEEAEIVREDGRRGFISMTSAPVRDAAGTIVAGLVMFHDITKTKTLERQLAQAHREATLLYQLSDAANRAAQLDSVFDTALSAILEILDVDRASILLFDDEGVMRFRAWRGLSDEYRRAVEGHSPWSRDEKNPTPILVDDVDANPAMRPYRDVFEREGIRAVGFVPLVYGDRLVGKFMVYRNAPRPFSAPQAALARTVAAQIASAVGRAAAEAALRESNRRKDEFLAMLSHELRNPLAATRSALSLLTEGEPGAEQARRYTGVIQRQTNNLVRIVDDLLDVSRVTRGLVELKRETLDLGGLVTRALEAVRAAIDAKGHAVSVTLPHKPVLVVGDPVRLEQVVVNLLSNAVKYTDAGGRISVTLEPGDGEVVLRVRDSGIGFAPTFREHIFDLFQQAPTGLDRAQGGLGIGLTIVKSLVELHGGRVRAHSEGVGRGSEFSVVLGLAHAETPAATAGERTRQHVAPDARRVLVVDDHQDSGEMLAALLESWGHVAHLAPDGATGLRLAEELRPDIILLDIGLPGLDGYEVARRLRADPRTSEIVLVALTGYGQDSDRHRAREAGFTHHLVKPVGPDALRAVLSRPLTAAEQHA